MRPSSAPRACAAATTWTRSTPSSTSSRPTCPQYADELQRSRDGEAVLRTQCDQLQARLTAAEQRLAEAQEQLAAGIAARTAVTVLPAEPTVPADLEAQLGDNPDAAAVLAVAQRTADEIVRFAQAKADGIRASVRSMLDEQKALLDQ